MKAIVFLMTLLIGQVVYGEEATYRVTFKGSFTKSNHPVKNFPSNPHFSPLIVAAHSGLYSMFQLGNMATLGVKNVAETGNPSVLLKELQDLEDQAVVHSFSRGAGTNGTGSASVTVTVSEEFPLISAVTMIAPSPDWIIGVSAYSLHVNGKFLQKRTLPLYAIDAGTDAGSLFTSGNKVERVPISLLKNVSGRPIGNQFGTLIIEKL